jgi:hypothetical protein
MRANGIAAFLLALIGLLISAAIGWAGLALWSPELAGVHELPPIAAGLPFERRWWALVLMLLGGAGIAAVFPPSVQPRRRPAKASPLALQPEVFALSPFEPLAIAPDALVATPAVAEPPPEPEAALVETEAVATAPEPMPDEAMRVQAPPSEAEREEAQSQEPADAASEAPPPGPFDPAPPLSVGAACAAAEALRQSGQGEAALERYHAILPDARARHAEAPDDAGAAGDLADVLKGVGDLEDEAGRLAPAIDAYEEGLSLRRRLAVEDPSVERRRALSVALERLADAREARGHRTQALALYEESLPIAEDLAAGQPDDPVLAADLATTRQRLEALKAWMATA